MEMLREICKMKTEDLKEAMKQSQGREQEMLARRNRVIPNHYGNRKERRAYTATQRKPKRELA